MGIWVLLTIIGLLFFLFHVFNRKMYTDLQKIVYTKAEGTVTSVLHDKTSSYYYVSFESDGKTLEGQSDHKPGICNKYHDGDRVDIRYWFTKDGKPMVVIDEPGEVPEQKKPGNTCLYISLSSLALAVVSYLLR